MSFRLLQFSRRSTTTTTTTTTTRPLPSSFFRRPFNTGRGSRFQSTIAEDSTAAAAAQDTFFRRVWNSPVGVKTVHFWAPVMKWAIVIAGISDFYRPAEKLSLTQNLALTATGAIWTRWCFIIKPRNLLLAAVNFFLGCVGVTQVSRIVMYHRSQNQKAISGSSGGEESSRIPSSAGELAMEVEIKTKGVVDKVKSVVKET